MLETRVGTRELKSKLSEYLRRVKGGETIIVTEHGKSIGQIIPLKVGAEERTKTMVAAGQAEWNGQKLEPFRPLAINAGNRQISELITEDRE
jgi:prevent-host-death family protein